MIILDKDRFKVTFRVRNGQLWGLIVNNKPECEPAVEIICKHTREYIKEKNRSLFEKRLKEGKAS